MRSGGIKKIPRGIRESTKANPAQLTNRELDILQLLQHAVQNKEIAGTLFISPKTADHHISNILFKLDVNSRVKAVAEAIRLGILKIGGFRLIIRGKHPISVCSVRRILLILTKFCQMKMFIID